MVWYLSNGERLSLERKAIDELFSTEAWLTSINWYIKIPQLCVDFEITIENNIYSARLIYPDLFPGVPPSVVPMGDDKSQWSSHQYGPGGELCLEWGPDNWVMNIFGADMIKSLYKLLITEKGTSEKEPAIAPSRHLTNIGQSTRSEIYRLLFHEVVKDEFNRIETNTVTPITFHAAFKNSCLIIDIHTVGQNEKVWSNSALPNSIHEYMHDYDGLLIKINNIGNFPDSIDFDALSRKLTEYDIDKESVSGFLKEYDDIWSMIIIYDSNNQHRLYLITKDFDTNKKVLRPIHVIPIPTQSANRLVSDAENLAGKHVAIVGAGSMGSKIAVSLTRSGVRKFTFIDDDIFLPENLTRNELDLSDVGTHKVEAVKSKCSLICPDGEYSARKIKLIGQESNRSVAMAISEITKCDLIIDATADPDTFNQLGFVAKQSNTPMCWGRIYAGGIGGYIARYRPGKDPAPHNMRLVYNAYCEENDGKTFTVVEKDYTAQVDEKVMVADDHHVTVIASYVTALSLDILREKEPSDFQYSLYLIGLQRSWVFQEPFDVRPIIFSEKLVENANVAEENTMTEENKSFLVGIINSSINENNPA